MTRQTLWRQLQTAIQSVAHGQPIDVPRIEQDESPPGGNPSPMASTSSTTGGRMDRKGPAMVGSTVVSSSVTGPGAVARMRGPGRRAGPTRPRACARPMPPIHVRGIRVSIWVAAVAIWIVRGPPVAIPPRPGGRINRIGIIIGWIDVTGSRLRGQVDDLRLIGRNRRLRHFLPGLLDEAS